MKKTNIMPTAVLGTICIVVAIILSLVNMITGPIIEKAQNAAANEALLVVLPDGKNFEALTIDGTYPPSVTAGYKADGGFVFQATVTGKSAGLTIMCGIDSEGKIVGTKVIANQETPDYASKVFPAVEGTEGKYKGMALSDFEPYLVSGATLTSRAYSEAIKAMLQAFAVANGGEVDIRTPEQILEDNCNAALGTSGVKFSKWFAIEVLDGVDAVYEAEDKSGRVYVIGETFIGIKADGTVVSSDADADAKAKATAADTVIRGSGELTVINLPDNIDLGVNVIKGSGTKIESIKKTNSGNYVFEIVGGGYDWIFEYSGGNMSGNPKLIFIKLSISADGKIIDVITADHAESKGIGDVCATEDYYDQYKRKGDSDIVISADKYPDHNGTDYIPADSTDVGAIAGATYTTKGYQTAIKLAFAAFNYLTAEGGNQ